MVSHCVSQQYESWAQTNAAHGSQVASSMVPAVQIGCAQVPPLEVDELLLELDELPLTQTPDWHTPGSKLLVWQVLPSFEGSGTDPHAPPLQVAMAQATAGQL
jgi:hypothetical protein